jgi:hypothetical protein
MSSFGTAKFQTNNLNLGFPEAYEDVYANLGVPQEYMPMARRPPAEFPAGGDFQAQWHRQKMLDANHMANAKVQATNLSRVRAFSSPHGYWQMPKPFLGQRKFANPSFGSGQVDIYPARPSPFYNPHTGAGHCEDDQGLTGGVLRSPAGQSYGIARLKARIAQLQAIANAKAGFDVGSSEDVFAGAEPTFQDQLGQIPQIELAQLLQSIVNTLMSGTKRISEITVKDSVRALSLIVRVATTGTTQDIYNILEFLEGTSSGDGILPLINALASDEDNEADQVNDEALEDVDVEGDELSNTDPSSASSRRDREIMRMLEGDEGSSGFDTARSGTTSRPSTNFPNSVLSRDIKEGYVRAVISLGNFWGGVSAYLKGMLPLASRGVPAKDRLARSKALLASSKLNRLNNDPNYWALQQAAENVGADFTNPLPQDVPRGAGRYVGGGDDALTGLRNITFNTGRRMVRREDTEHGYVGNGPAEYSENQRDVFAFQSGQYQDNTGGRPRGYFGEEEAEYADDVAALNAVNNTALSQGVMLGNEQGKLASKVAPGGVPSMMSSMDATTGTYDIRVQKQRNEEAQKKARDENIILSPTAEAEAVPLPTKGKEVSLSLPKSKEAKAVNLKMKAKEVNFVPPSVAKAVAPEGACPPKYGGKKYTSKDVPKDKEALIKFIGGLHQKHKGYSQAVYAKKDMNVANVRRNTMKKLKGAGLM